jgi:DNA-binding response OmpR family regulator
MADGLDAQLTAHLLSHLDGHVVTAGTLTEARRRLVERLWSVVVLDATLPNGGSWDLLHELADTRTESGVLVLGVSRDILQRVQVLEDGADDYLVRPYQPADLLARVKVLLRRFRQRSDHVEGGTICAGAIELDTNELVVTLPGSRRARLSPTEMRLLHYLMARAPRVVPHTELLARLFGPAEQAMASSSNAVGVYMRRVRRKIEPDPRHPRYIQTVRGTGYRFCSEGSEGDTPADRAQPSTAPPPGS